ncbi:MAG: DUF748 domain-containing protein [Nitrospira sp.]|nr:DUF748 domain-containing protein [Nitrospira sp.]
MESAAITERGGSRRSERTITNRAVSIFGFILSLVVVLGLVVVATPKFLRGLAESQLTSIFSQKTEIKRLSLNILTGHIRLEGLRVRSHDFKEDFALIDQIIADVNLSALFKRELLFTRLEIGAPVVHLVRSETAVWNLPALGTQHSASDSGSGIPVIIQHAVLNDGSLTIEDHTVSPPRTERVNAIHLTLQEVSPASSAPAKLQGSASLSDSGTIAIDGVVLPNLRSGNLDIELTNISLASLQGALSNHLHMQGRVTARLAVTWPGTEQSLVGISGTLKGQDLAFSSAGFRLGQATSVTASSVEISWPDRVAVDRLLVSNPEVWVRRNETGHVVGFQSGGSSSRKPTTGSMQRNKQSDDATSSPQWRIDKIVVQEGTVHLEDASVSPAYSDVLRNLEMTLDDIMPIPEHAMIIHARADIASGGALDLRGQAALFGSTPNASLKAAIHRFVVPSTNSYLKRTVSHYITDGTLTTVMHIRLSGDRLEVLSDVTLSDLEVEPVPHATHRTVQERIGLPLSLLLTLLKDETGRIHITFPISGPLSNPTFDWTNAIWATLRNVVMKLITLPIRSIGRFIMGSDDVDTLVIDPITFAPGSTTIRPDMDRTLHDLARLLRTETQTVLHLTPILSSTDLEALEHMPSESWPVPKLDTAETARHVLAVRRAFMVSARLAGMGNVPSGRLPVNPPRRDTSDLDRPRVELELEKGDGASGMGLASSGSER